MSMLQRVNNLAVDQKSPPSPKPPDQCNHFETIRHFLAVFKLIASSKPIYGRGGLPNGLR